VLDLILDAKTASVIAATIALGPPQAAPIAVRLMGPNLAEILLILSVAHLGSALIIFLFFQAIGPLIRRLRTWLAGAWVRLSGREQSHKEESAIPALMGVKPGSRYYFLGTVAFVFAFGSFLGVAATQAVGMRRSRAFVAVIAGCALSVVFWGLMAHYLSMAIDPLFISLAFIAVALGSIWRGKILENRVVSELRNMGTDGLRALLLIAQDLSPTEIAREMNLHLEEFTKLMARLQEEGYVVSTGKELYRATSRGLKRLNRLPERLLDSILQDYLREDE
jgi:predicted transcriptional regulator